MGRFAYLRPSKDVSLQHTCSSGSSGYAMIDEEECDNASTYIKQTVQSGDDGGSKETKSSQFTFTGSVPALKHGIVQSASLVVVAYRGSNGTYSGTISCGSTSGTIKFTSGDWVTTEIALNASDYACGNSYSKNVTISTTITPSDKYSGEARITQSFIKIYYDAEYTLISETRGHGGTVESPITAPWEEWMGPKIMTDGGKRVLRLLMDGIDVTSDMKYIIPSGTYTVNSVSGASYGFKLNDNNYYESQNKAQSNSAALCRVDFHCDGNCTANVYVINYAEATYDYGILSETEETLSTSYTSDSKYKWIGNTTAKNTANEQLITYNLTDGDDFIYIKYRKDGATDSNNDSLQFRIEMIPESTDPYYSYIIEGVDDDHTFLIYFELPSVKVDDTWNDISKIFKRVEGEWVEQTDYDMVFDEDTFYVNRIL